MTQSKSTNFWAAGLRLLAFRFDKLLNDFAFGSSFCNDKVASCSIDKPFVEIIKEIHASSKGSASNNPLHFDFILGSVSLIDLHLNIH